MCLGRRPTHGCPASFVANPSVLREAAERRVGASSSSSRSSPTRARGRAQPMIDVAGYLLNDTRRHRRHRRRCLTLRGEGTRRLTTIREISPLAQSFLSAVRLQCSGLTRYLSNTHALSLCKIRISSVWVSQRTIDDARFHVHFNHRTALRVWRSIGCNLARTIQDV